MTIGLVETLDKQIYVNCCMVCASVRVLSTILFATLMHLKLPMSIKIIVTTDLL